jgi:hypothetical protein
MSTSLLEFPNLIRGLQIPDASAEMAPGSLGIATDCDLTKSGTIKQRYGSSGADNPIISTPSYTFIHMTSVEAQMVSIHSGRTWTGNGTTITNSVAPGSGPEDGSGSVQMLRSALSTADSNTYVSSPTDTLWRWDGTSFHDDIPDSPKCRYVVQAGWAERLLYCGFDAGATNGPNGTPVDKSIVGVSNPSEPEVYTTDDTTSIAPGDGEDIMGAVTYNGQTFVFKETSFFVFYGESDSGGAVELLYNQRSGVGMLAPGCVTVGPDGVYFLAADGIYRTTGGTATCISTQVNGLFTGELPSWTPYNRNLNPPDTPLMKFATAGDRIYCAVSSTAYNTSGGEMSNAILVYDTTMQAWVGYYEFPVHSIHAMPWPDLAQPLIAGIYSTDASDFFGHYDAFVLHPLLSGDFGENNPVPMQAQLNWFQSPDAKGYVGMDKAAIHRLDLFGAGTFDVATVIDYQRDGQTSKEVDFGTFDPSLADVWGDGSDINDVWGTGGMNVPINNTLTLDQSAITADTDGNDLSTKTAAGSPTAPVVVSTTTFGGNYAVRLTYNPGNSSVALRTSDTSGGNMPAVNAGYYYEASAYIGDTFMSTTGTARMGITWYDSVGAVISSDLASTVNVTNIMPVTRLSVTAQAPVGAVSATATVTLVTGISAYIGIAKIQLREGDQAGNVSSAAYVDGFVSPTDDVWATGTGSETDLIRLYPPVHKYVFAPTGRGNYLALRFTKTATSGYAYLNPPRATLQSR